jgi:hypothetical protein
MKTKTPQLKPLTRVGQGLYAHSNGRIYETGNDAIGAHGFYENGQDAVIIYCESDSNGDIMHFVRSDKSWPMTETSRSKVARCPICNQIDELLTGTDWHVRFIMKNGKIFIFRGNDGRSQRKNERQILSILSGKVDLNLIDF